MLLMEITSNAGGYWEFEETDGVRLWTPVFEPPKQGSLFPFTLTTPMRMNSKLFAIQAYNLLPTKTSRIKLPPETKKMLAGLEDALKIRSDTDKIDPQMFQGLIDNCARIVVSKSGITGQDPKRTVITTPGSSSPVADQFARAIQKLLKVDDSHVFLGHFTKRDADDFFLDIMNSPDISDEDKDRIDKRNQSQPGDKAQSKNVQRGKRDVIRKAGIHMHEVSKEFKLKYQQVPNLLVVDDNNQKGTTYKSIADLFIKSTGVTPGKAIGLAMFKYP